MSIIKRQQSDVLIPYDVIDISIVEIIRELNEIGIVTVSSCSGIRSDHGIKQSKKNIYMSTSFGFAIPDDITDKEFIYMLQNAIENANDALINVHKFNDYVWTILEKVYIKPVPRTSGNREDIKYVIVSGCSTLSDNEKMISIRALMNGIRYRFLI